MTASEAWLLQSAPGLAPSLKRELVFVGAVERKQQLFIKRQRNHDLIFLNRLKSDAGLGRLRIAETVMRCPIFGRFKISKSQLQTMASELKAIGSPRRLVAQVAGRQFDRRDLARWLHKEMDERGYVFSSDEAAPEVWMICIDESYYFGIPLAKSGQAEGRNERVAERRGSLPPAVAAAMAFAGMPSANDVILDPVCGSGTLLAEAHAYCPEAARVGVDIDLEAIAIARANLGDGAIELHAGDSRSFDFGRRDISLVLANLPFGVQFGDRRSNPGLYRDIINNCLKFATSAKWRAVLLTSDLESLNQALAEVTGAYSGLETRELFRVKIRGEQATALLLKRDPII